MNGSHPENVVGVFADERAARAAVRFLEHSGFDPADVAVIDANVRQARELTGSRSPQGAAVGGLIGLIVFASFVLIGGPVMWSNWVALALGVAGFIGAGIAIGTLAGRARLFVADRGARYEDEIASGETLVSVHVAEPQRDRARGLLREAGAMRLREEGTVEAA